MTTIATANVFKGLDLDGAKHALNVVTAEKPDILALQEWGRGRDGLLRDLKGMDFTRPSEGGGPVVWRKDQFGLLRCNARMLAGQSFMGKLVGRKSTLPPSIATEAILCCEQTGNEVAVVNFHLTAEIQYAGKYRTDYEHAARVKRHKAEVRGLERIVAKHRKANRAVILCGDTNYDGLDLRGATACWRGRAPQHTLGKRTVDYIYAADQASHVKTLVTGSDHRAVVATYKEHR